MATWGLHIRIAERLLNRNANLEKESFLIGNIGPDCGVPNSDWSAFDPPTEVSHWKDNQKCIKPEIFLEKCFDQQKNMKEKSFLLGYYVHLLTDIEFAAMIKHKKAKDPLYSKLKEDKNFIWTIKKDWYDLDHLYFREHPDSIFFKVFQHIKAFPDYLHYYPKGAINRQVKYITDFYLKSSDGLDREYQYLSLSEMELFIEEAVKVIEQKLRPLLT